MKVKHTFVSVYNVVSITFSSLKTSTQDTYIFDADSQVLGDIQLMNSDKKFIGPESKCSHQINERQIIMSVHYFIDHIDLYTWKPQLKKLRGTVHFVLLILNSGGFSPYE